MNSIKEKIQIELRNEYWNNYNYIFKSFKKRIWFFLKEQNIDIKITERIFINIYMEKHSFNIFINQCFLSFHSENSDFLLYNKNPFEVMFEFFAHHLLEDILINCDYEKKEEISRWLNDVYLKYSKQFNKNDENIKKFVDCQLLRIKNIHLLNIAESILLSEDGIIKLDLLRELILDVKNKNLFNNIDTFFNDNFNSMINIYKFKWTNILDWFGNFNKLANNMDNIYSNFIFLSDYGKSDEKEIIKDLWITCFKIIGTLCNSANHELNFLYKINELILDKYFSYYDGSIYIYSKYFDYLKNKIFDEFKYVIKIENSKEIFLKLSVIKVHDLFNFNNVKFKKSKINIFNLIFSRYLKINNEFDLINNEENFISVYGYFLYLSSIAIILESNNINTIVITFLYVCKVIEKNDFMSLMEYLEEPKY